jgi:hypothetical protein
MKATLSYQLPEEEADFRNALDGRELRLVLWDLDQWLRSKVKYAVLPEAEAKAFEQAREQLRILAADYGVTIE